MMCHVVCMYVCGMFVTCKTAPLTAADYQGWALKRSSSAPKVHMALLCAIEKVVRACMMHGVEVKVVSWVR